MYDIIIVGMGISGITAAIYAKRSNKKVLLLDKGTIGGLLNVIDKVSNYPGLVDIRGVDFATNLEEQVKNLNVEYKLEEVVDVDLKENVKKVITKNGTYEGKKIILAMGRSPKYLGLQNEQELLGRGVSTCATCDAYFYKGADIAVVGTGNSALQEALYLSNIVNHIYLLNRRDGFRGDEILVEKVKENPKIEIIYNVEIKTLESEKGMLKRVALTNDKIIDVSGVFIYIGYRPATDFLPKCLLDEEGYVKINENYESSIKDVYAIGDVIKKDLYQLVTAASDGANVIFKMK